MMHRIMRLFLIALEKILQFIMRQKLFLKKDKWSHFLRQGTVLYKWETAR